MTNGMMFAARLHETGGDMVIEEIPRPDVRPGEILIKVQASNVVQNLRNILTMMGEQSPMSFPKLPAVFGLDNAGTVEICGPLTNGFEAGDRVYVNPGITCGGCDACRSGYSIDCEFYALRGYFGMSKQSQQTLDNFPQGGFAQYMSVSQAQLVRLPDSLDYDTASRLGYLGTAYRALKLGKCGPGKVVLINGATGTLGLGGVALALALGARKILGTARDPELLARMQGLAGDGRIEVLELGTQPVDEWAREVTAGAGVDIAIDALGGGAPVEPMEQALKSLKRGGRLINIGAVEGELHLDLMWFMTNSIKVIGSSWFTTEEGQEMAELVGAGLLDLSFFENETFGLAEINDAIADTEDRNGGFSNFVIRPNQ